MLREVIVLVALWVSGGMAAIVFYFGRLFR